MAVSFRTSDWLADYLAERLQVELTRRTTPVFVAVDGRSGCGKSTIAKRVADKMNTDGHGDAMVTVIEGDQFYGGGSLDSWDELSIDDRVDRVIDWRHERTLLQSLKDAGFGTWYSFDWDSEQWDSDKVPLKPVPDRCAATPIVILEGVYSGRPELADLFDIRVLIQVPSDVSARRVLDREDENYLAEWERRWSEAEDHYFGLIVATDEFDVVLDSSCPTR